MNKIILLIAALLFFVACKKEAPPASASAPSSAATDVKTVDFTGEAKVKETVVIRSKPDAKSERVQCDVRGGGDCPPEMIGYCTPEGRSVLTAGTEVGLTARTEEKLAVGKWKNYWYKLDQNVAVTCPQDAWVYGEFLNLQSR